MTWAKVHIWLPPRPAITGLLLNGCTRLGRWCTGPVGAVADASLLPRGALALVPLVESGKRLMTRRSYNLRDYTSPKPAGGVWML